MEDRMGEGEAEKAECLRTCLSMGFRNEWIDVLSVDKCLDSILGKMRSFTFALKNPACCAIHPTTEIQPNTVGWALGIAGERNSDV